MSTPNRIYRLILILIMSLLALLVRVHSAHATTLPEIVNQLNTLVVQKDKWGDEQTRALLVADLRIHRLYSSGQLLEPGRSQVIEALNQLKISLINHPMPLTTINDLIVECNLWSDYDFPSLLEKLKARETFDESAKKLARLIPKMDDERRKAIRETIRKSKSPSTSYFAFLYVNGLAQKKDIVTLIRYFHGDFLATGSISRKYANELFYVFPMSALFGGGTPFYHANNLVALSRLGEKFQANDKDVVEAVLEAKKLPALFNKEAGGLPPHTKLRSHFFKLLTTSGFSCLNDLQAVEDMSELDPNSVTVRGPAF